MLHRIRKKRRAVELGVGQTMMSKSMGRISITAHRLETTLIQTTSKDVAVWVRPDFLRPKGYKYPKHPRQGRAIKTDAIIW